MTASVLCTICARGGSVGVKNKNIKPLLGKPLLAYSIEQAQASKVTEHIVVSTDSDEIAKVAEEYGASVFFKRPGVLATNTAAKVPVFRHALTASEKYFDRRFDYYLDLDACSPLRNPEDIRSSLAYFCENDFDNLVSVMPARCSPYFNMLEVNEDQRTVRLSKPPSRKIVCRQESPTVFEINASVYIWRREILLNNDSVILENTGFYEMPEERSICIDTPVDWELVELLMRKKQATGGGAFESEKFKR